MSINFIDDLNESQKEAVAYCDGPSLVIAGAGSGKTRVLTYKIAYLIAQGMPPWNILALTFTNKAANEMKERITKLVGADKAQRLWMGTFHSLFYKILRRETQAIGFSHDITIYDTSDSKSLLKAIIKGLGLDDKVYKPSLIAGRISDAKNRLMLPEQYASDGQLYKRDAMDGIPETSKIYQQYYLRCWQANAFDFDDLLLQTFLLFKNHPEILDKYKQLFQYVLVDEYQDTNYAQYRIISQLTNADSRICVVGDDAQSIYGFRGADIGNILGFSTQYPSAKLFRLECNYRSTGCIVEAANSVIKMNRNQIPKKVYSNRHEGDKIIEMEAYSDKDESAKVTHYLVNLNRKGVSYNNIAILYRTNAQSRVFEETFRGMNIPYRIYGGLSFYQRKEIKDVLAYFRVIINPNDEEAFKRVLNYPARGIGDTTKQKLMNYAVTHNISLWETLKPSSMNEMGMNKGTQGKLAGFRELILSYMGKLNTGSLYDYCLNLIKESGISKDLNSDSSPENLSRRENVEELVNSIKVFEDEMREETGDENPTLADYLSQVSLLTDTEDEEDQGERVSLMTVHAAKGLEFEAVFIVGLEEDLFPNQMASYSTKDMEEERRLFYVALTRAKTYCFLSHAKSRVKYGQFNFANPSPFLTEIDDKYLLHERQPESTDMQRRFILPSGGGFMPHPQPARPLLNQQPSPTRRLTATEKPATGTSAVQSGGGVSVGQHIEHERFGRGEVTKIERVGESYKATVNFENVGTKALLLKFARFKIVP